MHRLVIAVLMAGAVLVLVGPAGGRPVGSADEITKTDPVGDVKAPGLTAAERNAIDIVSVKVAGEEGLGLFADVTFKGNFQKYAGRGHLKSVAAGLILRPKVGGTTTPAMLLSTGPGKGTTFRKTHSTEVGSFRDELELHFFIIGPGFDSVGSVQAKVETNLLPLPLATPEAHLLDPKSVTTFLSGPAADSSIVAPAGGQLSCPSLLALIHLNERNPRNAWIVDLLRKQYAERCSKPSQPGFELTFGDTPVCFVNNGPSTDVLFEHLLLRRRGTSIPPPPATGTLELKSTSGFDQRTEVAFDSTGKAAPVKFNLTSFGDYTANAVANVAGQTVAASTTFSLNKANDVTNC